MMKKINLYAIIGMLLILSSSCVKKTEKELFINDLVSKMTLKEKVGQMTLYSSGEDPTVPVFNPNFKNEISKGGAGAIFASISMDSIKYLQSLALKSRLKIPMLFGYDVIHGFKTVFPIPLAETASWDMSMLEKTAHVAAEEASASGINWFFAPMIDISRDARWGRVSEGAGEDVHLVSAAAVARVKGFQGENLKDNNTVAACAKHFAAYGAPEAGKDYNTVDMSESQLRDVYLKPFKAVSDIGIASMMSAFNEVNGIPSTANKFLLTDILRKEWNYKGFVVTDFASIRELMNHGYAIDEQDCADKAVNAGIDMDMEAAIYKDKYIAPLVEAKKIDVKIIDEAVKHILGIKYDLGLFDNPYKYCNEERAGKLVFTKQNLEVARDMARKSIVLLKNDKKILPLDFSKHKKIALIGPLADNQADPLGTWIAQGDTSSVVTVLQGLKNQLTNNAKIKYSKGCDIDSENKSMFRNAINNANNSDLVIMVLGEKGDMSGEAASKGEIGLPGVQTELLKEIAKTGKPIVLLVMNGRPITIEEEVNMSDAVVETWLLGTTTGDAIADVLTGKYNPSGKLPITFPRKVGQTPIYYAHKSTGRPSDAKVRYTSRYLDIPFTPLFYFGYGLSYTEFEYSNFKINKNKISDTDTITVSVDVKNIGNYNGEEVVQLYIQDVIGSLTRPVKELKAFEKIMINKGETKTITFKVEPKRDLSFTKANSTYATEDGEFKIFVGTDSQTDLSLNFELKN